MNNYKIDDKVYVLVCGGEFYGEIKGFGRMPLSGEMTYKVRGPQIITEVKASAISQTMRPDGTNPCDSCNNKCSQYKAQP